MAVKSLVQAWKEAAYEKGDSPAVSIGADITLGWADLHRRTNRVARLLAAHGVAHGDFVTTALSTSVMAVEAILATIKLGATPNVISPRLAKREREEIITMMDPRLVVDQSGDRLTHHRVIGGWEAVDDYSDDDLPDVVSPALKAPTSGGSTGRPKIIISGSPAVIDDDPASGLAQLGFLKDGCAIFPGPLYHNSALFGLLAGTGLRNHVVLEERFDPELTLRLVEQYRVDFALLVPTMMNRIWRLPEDVRRGYDLSSLRVVQHNAGACPQDLKRAWIGWLGAERVFENYTATEQTATTMVSGPEWLQRPGTVGRVISGEMEVRDDDGARCAAGEVGTIWMRRDEGAPRTFYYKGQETTETPDRWETVGDLGWMDMDGYLYLSDRRADLIICGGANVYPAEVENVISSHPNVVECVVVGKVDYDMGELVHAVVMVDNDTITIESIDEYVRARLSGPKRPRSYDLTRTALRDEAGKVRRSAVRKQYLAER